MLKLGIRSKLFMVSVILMLFAGLISVLYLERRLKHWLEGQLHDELSKQLATGKILLEQSPHKTTYEGLAPLADLLGKSSHARVTIIREDGLVVGDSQLSRSRLKQVENHKDRPEIRAALKKGEGLSRRYSKTLQAHLLYMAVPYRLKVKGKDGKTTKKVFGVLRMAVPLQKIEETIGKLRALLLAAAFLGLLVAILMSGLSSHLISRTLRKLVQNAKEIASGDRERRIDVSTQDELGRLAGSFNRMTDELERMLSTLTRERNRFEIVLENMNASVLALDQNHDIVLANQNAHQLLEQDEDLVGKPFLEQFTSPHLKKLVECVDNGEATTIEFDLIGKATPRKLLARATPLQKAKGSVIVLQDISELRRLENIRRDFVANVSHELRTPLSIIRANTETLLDGALEDPEYARDFLQALLRHAERLSRLVDDLLDLSRIEANQYKLQVHKTDIKSVMMRVWEALEATSQKKEQVVHWDVEEDVSVNADSQALEQVFFNLLDNAIKYTPEGGKLQITTEHTPENQIKICFSDNGPGLEARHRERIFERFYRVDKGRSRDMGGTGLGLAIVKHLTENMRGKVGVEPAAQGGSVFWLLFPIAMDSEPPA